MNDGIVVREKAKRLVSLDALRGFNMFWIVGAEAIADALSKLNFPGARFVAAQLNHAAWNGFTFYDLIYPMFIFLVGVSATFAIMRRKERGDSNVSIVKHILTRTVLMFLIGIYMSNSGLPLNQWLTNLRWMGVLQRIAICYGATALMVLYVKPRCQAGTAVVFLIGYWVLLRFFPVPGYGVAVWNSPTGNAANYFDSLYLPGRLYYDTWDPEGLLSSFPAVATCVLGALTGYWLKVETVFKGKTLSREQKTILLAVAGLILTGLGIIWGVKFPINKKIWTSSFALLAGGISAVWMAFFYWVIDLRGIKKWTFPFVVIGMNSIFIYLAADIVPFRDISRWLLGGKILTALGTAESLALALVSFLMEWLTLYVMYRRKIFLKL